MEMDKRNFDDVLADSPTQAEYALAKHLCELPPKCYDAAAFTREQYYAEQIALHRQLSCAATRLAVIEECAALVEGQPDSGVSYQTLWRIAGQIRALGTKNELANSGKPHGEKG